MAFSVEAAASRSAANFTRMPEPLAVVSLGGAFGKLWYSSTLVTRPQSPRSWKIDHEWSFFGSSTKNMWSGYLSLRESFGEMFAMGPFRNSSRSQVVDRGSPGSEVTGNIVCMCGDSGRRRWVTRAGPQSAQPARLLNGAGARTAQTRRRPTAQPTHEAASLPRVEHPTAPTMSCRPPIKNHTTGQASCDRLVASQDPVTLNQVRGVAQLSSRAHSALRGCESHPHIAAECHIGGDGSTRENSLASGNVRHVSSMRKSVEPAGNGNCSPWQVVCPHEADAFGKGRDMEVGIEVSIEQRQNERAVKTRYTRENPPTSGVVRLDSHVRKSGSGLAGNRARGAKPIVRTAAKRADHISCTGYLVLEKLAFSSRGLVKAIEEQFVKCRRSILSRLKPTVMTMLVSGVPRLQRVIARTCVNNGDPWRAALAPVQRSGSYTSSRESDRYSSRTYSPPPKANRVQTPAGSPDFRMWDSCRTMQLVGEFSRGSLVSPTLSFRHCSILTSITLIGSQDPAVTSRPNIFAHFTH
ncbi:hypothetical protein PR048_004942 [Dryococelus australis]|uniref:Uncharacterized protein n=1 Tax=Dryococelus australis TaxID=614101 RepID=A0ABQ9I6U3_9NEOP|nr:hypothetical protein PR048_004942 [Dryococelus australis]